MESGGAVPSTRLAPAYSNREELERVLGKNFCKCQKTGKPVAKTFVA